MTEREALQAAKDNVEIAMGALARLEEAPGDSYAADEAWWILGNALNVLDEGLESLPPADDTG